MSATTFFPHEVIRQGQDKLIDDLDLAFSSGKILIAHAPTGLGKTASALTVALEYALRHNKKVFFLTNRHTQHQIAVNTLKMMKEKTGKEIHCADLIGKKWMCSQEVAGLFGNEFNEYCKTVVEKGECEYYTNVRSKNSLQVEAKVFLEELKQRSPLHNEEVIVRSKEKMMCSYEVSTALAKDALIIIGDYYYLFNPFVQSTLFTKLELEMENVIVIVDEGHNLPGRITEMLSNNLSSLTLKYAIVEARKHGYLGVITWLEQLQHILLELGKFSENEFNKEKLIGRESFLLQVQKFVDYDELIAQLELAADEVRKKQHRSFLGGIASFLESWRGENKGFARFIAERQSKFEPVLTLHYSCLDPSFVTRDIFKRVYAGVIMSGTLKPTFMYKDILGIDRSREQEYGSPFPVENKLSLIIPETTTKYSARSEEMYKKIASKCSEIASCIPGNVAFFFPSYDLRDRISRYLITPKKNFFEKANLSKEEKELFLISFKAEKDRGGLLLGVAGANFAEGVDLPGDLLNGVVVVGLPLGKPDLKTSEIIKYYDEKFGKGWDYGYVYPAMNKCLQSAGRCIRSETDKGAVIFLDERFAWQNYFVCFPREGLRVSKEYGKMLKEFFGKEKMF